MNGKTGIVSNDVKKCVDQAIRFLGKDIKLGMTLALGKPILIANEFYRRAKEDPSINLKLLTALPLEKPRGHSELERRFLKPIADRVFDGVIDFDFMLDLRDGKLPDNVAIYEFFCKAGANLNNPHYQMNHISSNYTHCARDAFDLGCNVFAQLISVREFDGEKKYSMACNTDICLEAAAVIKQKRAKGEKAVMIAEANVKMPFMYGDAVVDADTYDIILQGEEFNYTLFGPPKDAVALPDHMIGINVSTLVRDGGTIQVGIGALGDAIVAGLVMRNTHNPVYREILEKSGIMAKHGDIIKKWGDTKVFKQGLYGSSEMFVDAFMQMYKNKILKRKVFDSIPLMELINKGELAADRIPADIIDKLIDMKAIHEKLREEDFTFLTEFGILKKDLKYTKSAIKDGKVSYSTDLNNAANRTKIRKILGKELLNGHVILGAFFVGPQAFYDALNDMSEDERKLFAMSGVEKVNQLYGGEELRALQRKDARFINTGMVATLLGSIASDQLQDGRLVSGIGGQYNFVSMAHALPDARLIVMVKSVKGTGKTLKSNIVFSYGHCSVPRHLRDIIVTEYGIADVRGKPDQDVIAALINIADSRFQKELLAQAKKAKKIPMDYEIPEEYRNNTPDKITKLLKPYQEQGYFQPFPFGTDLLPDDIALGGSLKAMKALAAGHPLKLVKGLLFELVRPLPGSAQRHIERMKLDVPASVKERIMRKMVVFALRNNKRL
ncbi:MAG TPA: acetyl-CoA hydrolase/transferase C-terminal domain-containing protein [Spirochaetota bacterium]|nr:acetyl-CoA hydrolase/transferase C-terminal domain-containing protein [Spirochaetota bacterium]HRX48700.1 acetyl-CoA hydrolase/transferase C-terminal domain-containing protein [Spirochaetota bacterium]